MNKAMIEKIKEKNLMFDTGSSAYYPKKLEMIGSNTKQNMLAMKMLSICF